MDKIFDLISREDKYQQEAIRLIPSENFISEEVKKALGSNLSNKYAEGYPGRRYYQGNKYIDEIENLAIERGKKLFGVEHMNVQAYSGSPANAAVLLALLKPDDKICGMRLADGGHLTHGHPGITFSGKYFESIQYGVNQEGKIDYEAVAEMVNKEKPKLIFCGGSAYPWKINWQRFSEIASSVNAYLIADIAHIAGLIAGGVHESPVNYVDIITSTTHKTLRGPRGAFIGVTKRGIKTVEMKGDGELNKKIDKAVFPGLQGGPHMNAIAAMAVAFEEASRPEFKEYAQAVVENAKVLAETLKAAGIRVFGTENHLMLVDCGVGRGKEVAVKLENEGVIVNANMIPRDQGSPMKPSGIRVGSPAMTTKGWGKKEFEEVGKRIAKVINS